MGNKNSGRRPPQIKPSPDQSSFGIWLTSYLSKHKLSIMDLSRLTGPTDRAIRDWIDGVNFPKFGPLLEIVEVISKLECCFIETILMEAIQTHPNFVMAKRRETKFYSTHTADNIGV
tara:strand:+ start:1628 stop:1978 length:351 start_codon:yes stop_codon:yes gene_type:complete